MHAACLLLDKGATDPGLTRRLAVHVTCMNRMT